MIATKATVTKVEERFTKTYQSGFSKDAKFEDVSLGWWIVIDSGVAFGVGNHKPEFKVGDVIPITLG